MDDIYSLKENLIPLKGGRSQAVLAKIAKNDNLSSFDKDLDEFNQKIAEQLDENEQDPLKLYHDKLLLKSIQHTLSHFKLFPQYKNDVRYVELWLFTSRKAGDKIAVFKYMSLNEIGTSLAVYYEEYASLMESLGKFQNADEIFTLGINRKAEPLDRLKNSYRLFLKDLTERTDYLFQKESELIISSPPKALTSTFGPSFEPQTQQQQQQQQNKSILQNTDRIFIKTNNNEIKAGDDLFPTAESNRVGLDHFNASEDLLKENVVEKQKMAGSILLQKKNTGKVERSFQVFDDNEKFKKLPNPEIKQTTKINKQQKTEKFAVNLDLLYTNSQEYSLKELLYKTYQQNKLSSSTSQKNIIKPTTTPKKPSINKLSSSSSQIYHPPTPPKKQQTTNSPTINTKAAIFDVFNMFNRPLDDDDEEVVVVQQQHEEQEIDDEDETISAKVFKPLNAKMKFGVFKDEDDGYGGVKKKEVAVVNAGVERKFGTDKVLPKKEVHKVCEQEKKLTQKSGSNVGGVEIFRDGVVDQQKKSNVGFEMFRDEEEGGGQFEKKASGGFEIFREEEEEGFLKKKASSGVEEVFRDFEKVFVEQKEIGIPTDEIKFDDVFREIPADYDESKEINNRYTTTPKISTTKTTNSTSFNFLKDKFDDIETTTPIHQNVINAKNTVPANASFGSSSSSTGGVKSVVDDMDEWLSRSLAANSQKESSLGGEDSELMKKFDGLAAFDEDEDDEEKKYFREDDDDDVSLRIEEMKLELEAIIPSPLKANNGVSTRGGGGTSKGKQALGGVGVGGLNETPRLKTNSKALFQPKHFDLMTPITEQSHEDLSRSFRFGGKGYETMASSLMEDTIHSIEDHTSISSISGGGRDGLGEEENEANRTSEMNWTCSSNYSFTSNNAEKGGVVEKEVAEKIRSGGGLIDTILAEEEEEEEEEEVCVQVGEVKNPVNPYQTEIIQTVLFQTAKYFESPDGLYLKQSLISGILKKFEDTLKIADRKDKTTRNIASSRSGGSGSALPSVVVDLPGIGEFKLIQKLGEGGFASVYLVESQTFDSKLELDPPTTEIHDPKKLYALKIQSPPATWEFYILTQLRYRLPEPLLNSIITPITHHIFKDESCLRLQYGRQGTLLNLVNNAHRAGVGAQSASRGGYSLAAPTQAGLDEILCAFFALEVLGVIEECHAVGFLHGDVKIDNFLVRLGVSDVSDDEEEDLVGVVEDDFEKGYDEGGRKGWVNYGVKLIDWGQGVDLTVFPNGERQLFVKGGRDEGEDDRKKKKTFDSSIECWEVRNGKPWRYEIDWYGVASVIHVMLFGKYMTVLEDQFQEDMIEKLYKGRIKQTLRPETLERVHLKLSLSFKRYWQVDVWNRLFDVLLNCGVYNSIMMEGLGDGSTKDDDGGLFASFPILSEIKLLKIELEKMLLVASKDGRSIKGLLIKASKIK